MTVGNVSSALSPLDAASALPAPDETNRGASFPVEQLYRLSVEQYHEMSKAGILDREAKVELLAGLLVEKMNINPPHVYALGELADAIRRLLPADWHVREQSPITLADSEPEPDIAIARGGRAGYRLRQPRPEEIGLIVEISDSSLREDRGIKKRLYAHAGVAEYWIVNIPESQIETYTQPTGPTTSPDFQNRRDYSLAEEVALTLDGQALGTIGVRDIIPGEMQ